MRMTSEQYAKAFAAWKADKAERDAKEAALRYIEARYGVKS